MTQKTVFLVALATARRVSEIQALSRRKAVITEEEATLTVVEGFVSKTQRPGDNPLTINIQANTRNGALCPVKYLKQYLDRTDKLSPVSDQLFISLNAPHQAISKDTVARWLASCIRDSYKSLDDCLLPHVNAHEIRAIAASMFIRNNDIDEIMSTGLWKSKYCFLQHYFREVDWDFSEIGSIVVANKMV